MSCSPPMSSWSGSAPCPNTGAGPDRPGSPSTTASSSTSSCGHSEHVFAIGDVANATNTALGAGLRVEHWDNAIRQGALAGRVLLGEDARYDWQPYFYTDQYDLGMEYVGRGSADDDVVIRGSEESGEFIAFWLRQGVVTAAMNVNTWDVSEHLRVLIGRRIDPGRLTDERIVLAEL